MPIPCSPYLSFPPLTTREKEVRDELTEALACLSTGCITDAREAIVAALAILDPDESTATSS